MGEFVQKCGWICSVFVVEGLICLWRWVNLTKAPTRVKIINFTHHACEIDEFIGTLFFLHPLCIDSSLFAHYVVQSKSWIHIKVKAIHVTAKAMWQQRRDMHERARVFSHMTWRLLYADMTHRAFTCVSWLMHDARRIHMCNMTHVQRQQSYVWHGITHMLDMTLSCVCHDSFMRVSPGNMTHALKRRDSIQWSSICAERRVGQGSRREWHNGAHRGHALKGDV